MSVTIDLEKRKGPDLISTAPLKVHH